MIWNLVFSLYYFIPFDFSHQRKLLVFHWSDSKSIQVSRTPLSILADLNNTVGLDGLHLSFYFQVFQSLYQSFGDCSKNTN